MLVSVSLFATNYYYYQFRFVMHEVNINGVAANYPVVTYSPVLMGADIITAIDGVSTKNLSEDAVYGLFESKPSATFTIKRWNKEFSNTLTGLPCTCHPSRVFSEHEILALYGDDRNIGSVHHFGYEQYTDKNIDFYKYKTYDIEFSEGGSLDMNKKQFADDLIQKLSSYGLERDTENPQMLFVIELFKGKKEQYTPPTTSISTNYKYGYDIFKGWSTFQYITSQQNPGHTDISVMYKITVTVMDVAQLKQKASIPPVLWSTNCYRVDSLDYKIEYFADEEFFDDAFLFFKPLNVLICPIVCNQTYYLGIYFDGNNPSVVAAIDPDGPAAKAGLKTGSKILSYKMIAENDHADVIKKIPSRPIPSYPFEKLWKSREEKDIKDNIPVYYYIYYAGKSISIVFQNNSNIIKAKDINFAYKHSPVYILK